MAFRRRIFDDGDIPEPYQPPQNAPARPPQGATTPPAPAPPAPAPPTTTRGQAPTAGAPAPLVGGVGGRVEANMAAQRSNIDYRDPAYSQAQWGAWEEEERKRVESGQSADQTPNKYNQNGQGCPPNLPFTSRPGPNGQVECAAKPDDCPDGSHVVGSPGRCVPNDAGAPGGGGVGGVAGGGAPGGAGLGAGFDEMNQWWKNQIQSGTSRYSPEVMAALEADAFARARRQEKLQLDAATRDMAERGVSRSPYMNATKRDIIAKTSGQIMSNRANLMRAKIDADYQDKQAAIKNAESWVNSMRDFLLRSDANAIQREQIAAQIRLAQQNISAQKDMLEQNYQNNLSMTYLTGGI